MSYAATLLGIVAALLRLRISPLAASAITVVLMTAWLTWPVWLSPYLTGLHADAIVARLVAIHPLFAVNGVIAPQSPWSHWPIAYRELTTLGQDVAYEMPTSIWPTALFHAGLGALL